jgi:hypothetical protein
MTLTSTFLKKFIVYPIKQRRLIAFVMCLIFVLPAIARSSDSGINKKAVVITDLEKCRIPASMVMRIKHLTPKEIKDLNEEYQRTDLTEDGKEIVTIVKLRFIDDHITGYIKESLINNSDEPQEISYIDIPIEWMCIPPRQDHPFHFATSLSEIDSIKLENGCLDWVQRDNQVIINFAKEQPKKKSKSARNVAKLN